MDAHLKSSFSSWSTRSVVWDGGCVFYGQYGSKPIKSVGWISFITQQTVVSAVGGDVMHDLLCRRVLGPIAGLPGFDSRHGEGFFLSPQHPNWLYGPPVALLLGIKRLTSRTDLCVSHLTPVTNLTMRRNEHRQSLLRSGWGVIGHGDSSASTWDWSVIPV
jgi:hypothetical protein